jgi:hypothetical protein
MSFCDHCEGQRFDRARVLRALRAARLRVREEKEDKKGSRRAEEILVSAIQAVRTLDIPHLERWDDVVDGEVVH